jgi:hypothetical protein
MAELSELESRIDVLSRRIRRLQFVCTFFMLLVVGSGVAAWQQRKVRSMVFTDSLIVPIRFWEASSFVSVGADGRAAEVALTRLGSNETVRLKLKEHYDA